MLEKRCTKFMWNRFNSPCELHKSVVKYFYNGESTLSKKYSISDV